MAAKEVSAREEVDRLRGIVGSRERRKQYRYGDGCICRQGSVVEGGFKVVQEFGIG